MKRTLCFATRNWKEMVRDPISLFFGVLFPVILLGLLTLINSSLPPEAGMTLFEMDRLAPGIGVFSMSFIALFSAMLISKDRGSSFMLRLYTSPLSGAAFVLGYLLPLLPMGLCQLLVCFAAAAALGLKLSAGIFLSMAASLPILIVNIALGVICGTCLSEKAVGGICGALLTNVSAWLSGIWFPLELVSGLRQVAYVLPFANAVDACRAALAGDLSACMGKLWIVCLWAVGLLTLAIILFTRKTRAK